MFLSEEHQIGPDSEVIIQTDTKTCFYLLIGAASPSKKDVLAYAVFSDTFRLLLKVHKKLAVSVFWLPREDNEWADLLAGFAREFEVRRGDWVGWDEVLGYVRYGGWREWPH